MRELDQPVHVDRSASGKPAASLVRGLLVFVGALVFNIWLYRDLLAAWPDGRVWEPMLRDADQFVWSMRAVPRRVADVGNPFVTDVIFSRDGGANLAYNTAAPGVALLALPVTAMWGPVAALTVVTVLIPPLTSLAGLWLLSVVAPSARGWTRVVGALMIGFCPALMLRNGHHVNLAAAAPLLLVAGALCARIVLTARREPVRPLFGVLLGAACGAIVWVSTELLALAAISLAAPCLLLALIERPTWAELVEPAKHVSNAALVGLATALLISLPFALALFFGPERFGEPYHEAQRNRFGVSLENIVAPVASAWPVDIIRLGMKVSNDLPAEAVGYLSVAGIAAAVIISTTFGSASRRLRFTTLGFWSGLVLSLGPALRVGEARWGWLPWSIVEWLPVVDDAIPNRLAFFSFSYLVLALVLANQAFCPSWLARLSRFLLVATALLLVPVAPFGVERLDRDMANSIVATCGGADVLVVPRDLGFGTFVGPRTMAWQAAADMRFDLVRGWAFRASSPAEGDQLALDDLLSAPTSTDVSRGQEELQSMAPICLVAPIGDDALQRAVNRPAVEHDGWRIWLIDQTGR